MTQRQTCVLRRVSLVVLTRLPLVLLRDKGEDCLQVASATRGRQLPATARTFAATWRPISGLAFFSFLAPPSFV